MFVFFFFKQKTAYEMRISDWSSDVCSSDLLRLQRCEVVIHLADETSVKEFHVIIEKQHRLVLRHGREGIADGASPVVTGIDHLEIYQPLQPAPVAHSSQAAEIGRASCRDRACQYV